MDGRKKRKLSVAEQRQIEYLERHKDALIYEFIGACEDINEQIKAVRNGEWLRQVLEN